MKDLIVRIERSGVLRPVGSIRGESTADARFAYAEDYLKSPDAAPVSISLPLRAEAFSAAQTKAFFEGLLPEGFTRRTVAQWMHVAEDDYLSILHGLGRECLGAVCITSEGEESEAAYSPVPEEQIRELAAEGATKSAELLAKTHLSLTGASGKVGLYYDAGRDAWYLPWGTAPSTHIVKQSHVRLAALVTNEQLSLRTAAHCGIDVPRSFIINTGNGAEHEVLFATERYDRLFAGSSRQVSGLPCPLRLHQEDFAQAMGIPAASKYEGEPSGYMKRMFAVLRQYSADPIADQLKLWDRIVFHYLIGNTDAHIKNISLLYSADWKTRRLAPAYDIVSTTVYEQSTRDMAFYIGAKCSLDEITAESFRQAAREAGIGEKMAMRRCEEMAQRFRPALQKAADELVSAGYPKAAELKERILNTGGIARL